MKNDKLLTELRRIEADLIGRAGAAPAYNKLATLIMEVEAEIREECNDANGQRSVAKAALSVLKTAKQQSREALYKAYRSSDGLLVCDSFRALRFTLNNAPALPEHPASFLDYPCIERVISSAAHNSIHIYTPKRSDLVTYIKTEKARLKAGKDKSGVRLILTDGHGLEIHVNAEFLLDMLDALPGAQVTASTRNTAHSGLYFKAENGDGVLLPMRKPGEEEQA